MSQDNRSTLRQIEILFVELLESIDNRDFIDLNGLRCSFPNDISLQGIIDEMAKIEEMMKIEAAL